MHVASPHSQGSGSSIVLWLLEGSLSTLYSQSCQRGRVAVKLPEPANMLDIFYRYATFYKM